MTGFLQYTNITLYTGDEVRNETWTFSPKAHLCEISNELLYNQCVAKNKAVCIEKYS